MFEAPARAVAISIDMGMDRVSTTTINWDPFDEDIDTDPYDTWRALRDDAPVYHNDRYDFWLLSRFDDIEVAHRQLRAFSSAYGITLDMMRTEPMDTGMIIMPTLRRTPSCGPSSRVPSPPAASPCSRTASAVLCRDLLDAQAGQSGFDYVQDFGAIVPPTVISMLLGIPEEDQEHLRETVDRRLPHRAGRRHDQRDVDAGVRSTSTSTSPNW